MEVVPAPAPPRHDLTVMQSALPVTLLLLPNCPPVRTGMPLVLDGGGWRGMREGETPLMFSTSFANGGEKAPAARAIVVETHVRSLTPGRVKIIDLQSPGALSFVNDPDGPYLALTRSQVLLG